MNDLEMSVLSVLDLADPTFLWPGTIANMIVFYNPKFKKPPRPGQMFNAMDTLEYKHLIELKGILPVSEVIEQENSLIACGFPENAIGHTRKDTPSGKLKVYGLVNTTKNIATDLRSLLLYK